MTRTIIALLLAAIVLAATPLVAAENETNATVDVTVDADAGVTPDSVLYGLDVALDKLRVNLARDPEVRAQRALAVAEERLLEVRAMVQEHREADAEKAERNYADMTARAEKAIENAAADASGEASIEAAARLRARAVDHYTRIVAVHEEILARQSDRMNQTQLEHLEEVFADIAERAADVDGRAALKMEQARARARAELNLSEDGLAELESDVEARFGLQEALERRQQALEQALERRAENARADVGITAEMLRERLELRAAETLERVEERVAGNASDEDSKRDQNRTTEADRDHDRTVDVDVDAEADVETGAADADVTVRGALTGRATGRR